MRVLWQIFTSTLAAFFGVQSEVNRQKDFQAQSPLPYIIMGIILAVLLVASLILLVNQVLS
jgi:hypothetical protein